MALLEESCSARRSLHCQGLNPSGPLNHQKPEIFHLLNHQGEYLFFACCVSFRFDIMEPKKHRVLKEIEIIKAPSSLGLQKTGVEGLADTLLSAGLAEGLLAKKIVEVLPFPNNAKQEEESGLLNVQAIAEYSRKLANVVTQVLDEEKMPLVLGGDCSILLGCALGLKRRGRFGLLFADGHTDFYQPQANINGEVASSELALATGNGTSSLAKLEGYSKLFQEQDVSVFGFRDEAEPVSYTHLTLPTNREV